MGSITFDIAAILLLIFNFFLFYSRRRFDIPQTGIFLLLLYISLGATVMDVITVVTYERVTEYPRWLIVGVNTLYYMLQNSIAPVFCVFILVLDGVFYRLKRVSRRLLLVPALAAMLIILPTPITGFAFSFDETMHYSRGPGLMVLYAISALYAVICIASLIRARASLSRHTILGLVLFLPSTLGTFVVQFFHPELLIVNFGIAVSELIILLTVNDFDVYIDGQTRMYNRSGLAVLLESIYQRSLRAAALIVILENKEYLEYAAGAESSSDLERRTIEYLFGSSGGRRFAARLDFGEYVIVLFEMNLDSIAAEKARILDCLGRPLPLGQRRFALHARLCEIRIPDDAEDALAVFQAHRALSLPGWNHPRDSWLSLPKLSLARAGRQLQIVETLKRAIERSELKVMFQPIVEVRSGTVVAAEALVRFSDEQMGPVAPDEFIPIAERNGLIHSIGDFVVERCCEFLASMRGEGLDLQYLDVNLSPVQFVQYNLSERMLSIASRNGLRSSDLCFEVTETAAALSPLAMRRTMDDLVSRGFSVAIDDFGVGNSNISSLIQIPFTTVKLDRSLIVAGCESDSARAELEGVIIMFKRVGVMLIAEGVETACQADILKTLGVDYIQGFLYSRPLSSDAFKAFFRERNSICM